MRLREIEARINELSGLNKEILCFQMKYKSKYEPIAQKEHKEGFKIRWMQKRMFILLCFLWVVVLIVKSGLWNLILELLPV